MAGRGVGASHYQKTQNNEPYTCHRHIRPGWRGQKVQNRWFYKVFDAMTYCRQTWPAAEGGLFWTLISVPPVLLAISSSFGKTFWWDVFHSFSVFNYMSHTS